MPQGFDSFQGFPLDNQLQVICLCRYNIYHHGSAKSAARLELMTFPSTQLEQFQALEE